MHRVAQGSAYERAAQHYLELRGLRFLARNFRCRAGEIDLIMMDTNILVFVEVRYRANQDFGSALESITKRKQARVVRAAANFLQRNAQFQQLACRFDAVGISGASAATDFCWIKAAFSA